MSSSIDSVLASARTPLSLRSRLATDVFQIALEATPGRKVTVGCLSAVASTSAAEAQAPLAPVTVEAPVAKKKPAATKPTAEQLRVRAALRRAAREKAAALAAA